MSEVTQSRLILVRALGGTEAVQTLTSLASFVKDERLHAKADADVFGPTLHTAKEMSVSPFRWSVIGGRPSPLASSPARRSVRRSGSYADSPRWRI